MKLYELTEQYRGLALLADDPDMPAEAIEDTLEAIEGDIEAKAQGLLQVVNGIKADVSAVDDEIKRLQAIKKARQNRIDSLRDYLHHNMEASDISKISCPLFTITLAKPRAMVSISNEDELPDKYKEEVKTTKIDKAAILKDLKAGYGISGAELVDAKRSLLIR